MKIATWNLNWPRPGSTRNVAILEALKEVNADILILTETNTVINPGGEYTSLCSDILPDPKPYDYKAGDHEVIIWSKHRISKIHINESTTGACVKVEIGNRALTVYGTVIGILGPVGRNKDDFLKNLERQIEDWEKVCNEEDNLCIIGDFNVCWSKGFPKTGRDQIDRCFDKLGIHNLTRNVERDIDHIAISNSFLTNAKYEATPHRWNTDEKLSDHVGISMSFEFS